MTEAETENSRDHQHRLAGPPESSKRSGSAKPSWVQVSPLPP